MPLICGGNDGGVPTREEARGGSPSTIVIFVGGGDARFFVVLGLIGTTNTDLPAVAASMPVGYGGGGRGGTVWTSRGGERTPDEGLGGGGRRLDRGGEMPIIGSAVVRAGCGMPPDSDPAPSGRCIGELPCPCPWSVPWFVCMEGGGRGIPSSKEPLLDGPIDEG